MRPLQTKFGSYAFRSILNAMLIVSNTSTIVFSSEPGDTGKNQTTRLREALGESASRYGIRNFTQSGEMTLSSATIGSSASRALASETVESFCSAYYLSFVLMTMDAMQKLKRPIPTIMRATRAWFFPYEIQGLGSTQRPKRFNSAISYWRMPSFHMSSMIFPLMRSSYLGVLNLSLKSSEALKNTVLRMRRANLF